MGVQVIVAMGRTVVVAQERKQAVVTRQAALEFTARAAKISWNLGVRAWSSASS